MYNTPDPEESIKELVDALSELHQQRLGVYRDENRKKAWVDATNRAAELVSKHTGKATERVKFTEVYNP